MALELAERRRDAERLVVLEDRDRIAKDLHDTVIQRLFAATAMALIAVKSWIALVRGMAVASNRRCITLSCRSLTDAVPVFEEDEAFGVAAAFGQFQRHGGLGGELCPAAAARTR